MNNATPIIIADDHPIVRRRLLRRLMQRANSTSLLKPAMGRSVGAHQQWQPPIVVLDIDMPLLGWLCRGAGNARA
ncbi:MAG: hypothetical protein U0Y68_13625 [Blastocatellia bacterium]